MGVKGQSGGKKGRSGRKSRAEEMGLAALLDCCWSLADRELCLTALGEKAASGDLEATKLLMAYTYGKPKEQITVDGGEPIKVVVQYVSDGEAEDS